MKRRRQVAKYRPLRIVPVFTRARQTLAANPDILNFLENMLVPATIEYIGELLSVIRVSGTLRINRQCKLMWEDGSCKTFFGVPDCGTHQIPQEHLAHDQQCAFPATSQNPQCTALAGGAGVTNADYVMYVSAEHGGEAASSCGDGQLTAGESESVAYAGMCFRDQFDRPIAGFANFCPLSLSLDPQDFEMQKMLATHEFMHALGFSLSILAWFRFPDGTSRTDRLSNGQPASFDPQRQMWVPSANTMRQSTENGKLAAKIVTEKVVQKAREFFDCATLDGMELEDQGGDGTALAHWEQRIARFDVMVGESEKDEEYMSPITLALFEDSGWYKAQYSAIAASTGVNWWGRNAGCGFLQNRCIENGEAAYPKFWCTEPEKRMCTSRFLSAGKCSTARYIAPLPAFSQYFSSDVQLGGCNQLMDYCPVVLPMKFANGRSGLCTDGRNLGAPYHGEAYSHAARCFESNLLIKKIGNSVFSFPPGKDGTSGRCYVASCSADLRTLCKSSWVPALFQDKASASPSRAGTDG